MNLFFRRLFGELRITEAVYDPKLEVMTVKYEDDTVSQYHGDGTVWNTYPMMKSCDTFTQKRLYGIWRYTEVFGNPYPTAHNKKQ